MMKCLYLAVFSSLLGFAIAHSLQYPNPQAIHPGQEFHEESPVDNRFIAFPLFSSQPDSSKEQPNKAAALQRTGEEPSEKSVAWQLEEASMYFLYRLLRGFAHLYH